MDMHIQMDKATSNKFVRGLRNRRSQVGSLGRTLIAEVSHFGIRRGRELTKVAIEEAAGEGHPEFEAVLEDGRWSDVGTFSVTPSYKWVTRRVRIAGKLRTRRYLRRRYPRHIKVYAEKAKRTARGWGTAIVNRTKGIVRLNERSQIAKRLVRDMAKFAHDELGRLKKRLV